MAERASGRPKLANRPESLNETQLGASLADLEWTINAYNLALGCLMLTGAALGDRFGRRRTYVLGLVVFTAGSVLAALSPGAGMLIAARVVQGAGGAGENVAAADLVLAADAIAELDAISPARSGLRRFTAGSADCGWMPRRTAGSPRRRSRPRPRPGRRGCDVALCLRRDVPSLGQEPQHEQRLADEGEGGDVDGVARDEQCAEAAGQVAAAGDDEQDTEHPGNIA